MINSACTPKLPAATLIEGMSEYVERGTACAALIPAERAVGPQSLRRVCIGLLSWLRSRARLPKMSAMKVSEVGSSELALTSLLDSDASFSGVFVIQDGKVHLCDELPPDEVAEIVSTAERLYHPPRFVTRRTKSEGRV